MIVGINKKELYLLKFSKSESLSKLNWEHANEFEYLGKMYDIVEKTIKNDSIIYLCWLDKEETTLNKKLKNLVQQALGHNPLNQDRQHKLVSFYKNLYTTTCSITIDTILHKLKKDNHFYYAFSICPFYQSPTVPPPEYC